MSLLLAIILALLTADPQDRAGANNSNQRPNSKPPASLIDIVGMDKLVTKIEAAMEKLGRTWETSADRVMDRATLEARQVVQPYEVGAGVVGGMMLAAVIVAGIALGVSWAALRSVKRLQQ